MEESVFARVFVKFRVKRRILIRFRKNKMREEKEQVFIKTAKG